MRAGELGERRFVGREIELDPAGVDRAADLAAVEVRDDRLAGLDADGRLRFVGARAQVRREHDVLQAEQRMILRRRLGLHTRRCAAPAIFFSFSASASANSSTTSPRASLMTSRFGLHLLNRRSRLSRCLVCSPPGTWKVMTSICERNSSKSRTSFTLPSSAVGAVKNGSKPMTFISIASARVATVRPMRPRPTTPSVLPASCVPW